MKRMAYLAGTLLVFGLLLSFSVPHSAQAYKRITNQQGQLVKWTSMPVSVQYNHNGFNQISAQIVGQVIQRSLAKWTAPQCTSLKTRLSGTTTSRWSTTDRNNVLIWNAGIPHPQFTRALALTLPTFANNGAFQDADIIFNGSYQWSTTPSGQQFDVEGTMTHELGHLFGLDHTNVASASMFPTAKPGLCPCRTLQQDDISGICAIYPGSGGSGNKRKYGESCNPQTLCDTGLTCVQLQSGATSGICYRTCPSGTCANGEKCHTLTNGAKACVCRNNTECSGGKTCSNFQCTGGGNPGTGKKVGEVCNGVQIKCATGLICLRTTQTATTGLCFKTCPSGTCADGEKCHPVGGGVSACYCRDATQCSGGKQCTQYRCQGGGSSGKKPGLGESCSNSIACDTGLACVQLQAGSPTGVCFPACPNGTCAGGERCYTLTNNARACVCRNDTECSGAGKTCSNYRCVGGGSGGTAGKEGGPCGPGDKCEAGTQCIKNQQNPTQSLCVRPCKSDQDCTAGRKCHPQYGACVAGNAIGNQGKGQSCSPQQPCKAGLICTQLKPQDKTGICFTQCTQQGTCPGGESCATLTGRPEKICACLEDKHCSGGKRCVNYHCEAKQGGCSSDADCPATHTCQNSQCVPKAPHPNKCTSDLQCQAGKVCKNGTCVTPPNTGQCQHNLQCKAGQICQNGKCIANPNPGCTTNLNCKIGETCQNGKCVPGSKPGCTDNSQCQNGQVCKSGTCVAPSGCTSDSECNGVETCQNGKCLPKKTDPPKQQCNPACRVGFECRNGACVQENIQCKSDDDCKKGMKCRGGTCFGSGGTSDAGETGCQCNSQSEGVPPMIPVGIFFVLFWALRIWSRKRQA